MLLITPAFSSGHQFVRRLVEVCECQVVQQLVESGAWCHLQSRRAIRIRPYIIIDDVCIHYNEDNQHKRYGVHVRSKGAFIVQYQTPCPKRVTYTAGEHIYRSEESGFEEEG